MLLRNKLIFHGKQLLVIVGLFCVEEGQPVRSCKQVGMRSGDFDSGVIVHEFSI